MQRKGNVPFGKVSLQMISHPDWRLALTEMGSEAIASRRPPLLLLLLSSLPLSLGPSWPDYLSAVDEVYDPTGTHRHISLGSFKLPPNQRHNLRESRDSLIYSTRRVCFVPAYTCVGCGDGPMEHRVQSPFLLPAPSFDRTWLIERCAAW